MSLFLLSQDQYYSSLKTWESCKTIKIQQSNQKSRTVDLGDNVNNESKSLKQCILSKIVQQSQQQRHVLMMSDLSYQLKGLFSIKTNKKKQLYSFFVDILAEDDNYYKVANAFQVVQICRNFISHHACAKNTVFCLKLNPSQRQIKIQLPFYLNSAWSATKSVPKLNQTLNLIFKTLIRPHLSLVQFSLKNILKQEGRGRSQDHLFQKPNKKLQLLKTYSSVSFLASHITCQPQVDSMYAQRVLQKQKQQLQKIMMAKLAISPQVIKNNHLFAYPYYLQSYESGNVQNVSLQQVVLDDDKNFQNKISFPVPSQSQKPQDNYMVYNKIEIKQINQKQLQKINKGGFADIYLTQISFWYPFLSDSRTPNPKTQSNLLSERVVIKREIPTTELFDNERDSGQESRREHEFKILQKLKKGKSIYIPKYYFPVNTRKTNTILDNCLLIEYIPFKTLGQLLQNNAKYFSLYSKLSLMFNLCQGIRYLRDFDIVHLDIKPSNILTYFNSYIKLIDFGESYHPDVCMKDYKPGFSMPYSPPEIFNDEIKSFNSKSDVFSMGVIFYQMLFNEFPFGFYKNTTLYNQEMKKHLQEGWYYTPEEKESYGQGEVLRILIGLISRCLSFTPQNRPELDWVAIILKHLLQIVF